MSRNKFSPVVIVAQSAEGTSARAQQLQATLVPQTNKAMSSIFAHSPSHTCAIFVTRYCGLLGMTIRSGSTFFYSLFIEVKDEKGQWNHLQLSLPYKLLHRNEFAFYFI